LAGARRWALARAVEEVDGPGERSARVTDALGVCRQRGSLGPSFLKCRDVEGDWLGVAHRAGLRHQCSSVDRRPRTVDRTTTLQNDLVDEPTIRKLWARLKA
jgi:hypothetical protein